MVTSSPFQQEVLIVGAGISGLSLAVALKQRGIGSVIFEATSAPGGNMRTVQLGNYRFDTGPNSLLANASTYQFLADIGAIDQLVPPAAVSKKRFILLEGKPRLLPSSPLALIFSNFFSWQTKWRILTEFFRKNKGEEKESLANFVRRRFSAEVVEKVLKPFVAGIYAGDAEALLVSEAFPQLVEYEQQYGSVLRGLVKAGAKQRRRSYSFQKGMQTLAHLLAQKVTVHYNRPVASLERTKQGFQLAFASGECLHVKKVVLALPAYQVAKLLSRAYPEMATTLAKVSYPPLCVVHTAFEKNKVGYLPNGFGLLHPPMEGTFIAGSIWSSCVFPDSCPPSEVLFTNFVGGAMFAQHAMLPQEEIVKKVVEELRRIYCITAPATVTYLTRWEKSIPQYDQHITAAKHVAATLRKEGIICHSNWVHGISLADCITASIELAKKWE